MAPWWPESWGTLEDFSSVAGEGREGPDGQLDELKQGMKEGWIPP